MKLVLVLSLGLFSSISFAAGDAAAGKGKAAVCAACHGGNGVSLIPNYPNLAGQKSAYIVTQLMAFKSGERKGANSAVMAPMTMNLSETDMADLAAYYESLPAAK